MADNTFRANRSRDPIARDDVERTPGDFGDNPLADLARLIGQRERVSELDRSTHYNGSVQTLDQPAADQEWTEVERYPDQPQHHGDEGYVQPRLPDYPADRGYAQYDDTRAPAPVPRYAAPEPQAYEAHYHDDDAHDAEYRDDPHDETRSYEPRYREEPPRAVARQAPDLAPQSHDEYDEQWDDESDIPEEYDDDSAGTTRRSGLAIVLAVLGLVLIGAAGAYAYRAMYGGAILVPSLPPIIKPADGPSKIVPTPPSGSGNAAAGVNPSAPAQLVPRQEQPVPVQPPPAPPRVLSTIPVAPAPNAPPSPFDAPPAPNAFGQAPPAAPAPTPVAPKVTAPSQPQGAVPSTEPKKIHTVPIRPDQGADASAAAPMPVAPAPPPAAAPRARTAEPSPPRSPPAPKGPNAPLSLVPGSQGAAPAAVEPAPRTRVAHAEPAPSAPAAAAPAATAPAATAPPATGGYAVQVTSQRSEAEAQSAFRELQGKYPTQLGNRQPIIHRADLGEKGTYYRAMVGPFGSAEAASSLCSSIKAAGGSCIVQKN